ncbi:MFS transporter [Desulfurella sp.]|uniref:MFS transporter n=1 Tax=Desulfurella sp. TaxID=1962857 RepID=UPI0025BA7ABF|nr:MFS transporter [Desulfurella sp.]
MEKQGQLENISERLERLPMSRFHWNFLWMVTAGEWFDTIILLNVGIIVALLGIHFGYPPGKGPIILFSYTFFGMLFGALILGRLADLYGRRTMYFFNLLIFGIPLIVASFMNNLQIIEALIFLSGMGIGAEGVLMDTFISEIMPKKTRGKRLALAYTLVVTAAPIGALIATFTQRLIPNDAWRVFLAFAGVGGLIVWVVRFKMIESPRWLESKGEYDKASKILDKIEESIMKEYNLSSLPEPAPSKEVKQEKSRYTDLFKKGVRGKTFMMFIFMFFQSALFYGFTGLVPLFLAHRGINLNKIFAFTFVIYTGFLLGSFFNIFVIDKVERKWGLIVSIILVGIFGLIFAFSNNIYLALLMGFLTTFSLWNMSNFYHQYNAEIFPTHLRGSATGSSYAISRFSTAILPTFIGTYVYKNYGIGGAFIVLWVFILILVVDLLLGPKSTGKNLEEI